MGEASTAQGASKVDQLLWDHRDVLRHYPKRYNAERSTETDAAIDAINETLPRDSHRLVTDTNPQKLTKVYERDSATGQYKLRSTLTTVDRTMPFIGDRLERIEDELVITDSELGGGINVQGALRIMPIEEIHYWGIDRFYAEFLEAIDSTEPSVHTHAYDP